MLPLGYLYAATYAGIRKAKKDDLSLIVSQSPASAAAIFTRNRVQAAPLRLGRAHLASSKGVVSAVLINAGNANAATRTGDKAALDCCRGVAKTLGMPVHHVFPSSTGVIGVELDQSLIIQALPKLAGSLRMDSFQRVAEAIMTTDTVPKTSSAEVALAGGTVRIAGMTKGSGMIQPNMATTLGFILTDAVIPAATVRVLLTPAAELSYHRISVDGDTSTNDTLLLLANGASGVKLASRDRVIFAQALTKVMQDLAMQIARDGEGATKLITITVTGTKTDAEAAQLARAIANSPLVKTAIAGNDPNWGRILSAAGNAGVSFDPELVDVRLQGLPVCRGGVAADFSEKDLARRLNAKDVAIEFEVRGKGLGRARFWTCDFTEDYIRINGSYRT